jgi:hypothetical protein
LGHLQSLEDFYSLMGPDFATGLTFTEEIKPEVMDPVGLRRRDYPQTRSENASVILTRANDCTDLTSWQRFVCDNMPDHKYIWSAGSALIIYYVPALLANWLNVSPSRLHIYSTHLENKV